MLKKIGRLLSLFLFIALLGYSPIFAQQNVDYRSLTLSNQQQDIYVNHFTLPGDKDGTVKFVTSFRISNQFLPFKKTNSRDNPNEFFSSVGLSIELFKAKNKVKKDNFDDLSIEGLESVGRAFWKDTAYAGTYEKTQSADIFIEGYLQVELKSGLYNYILQLERGAENAAQSSRTRQVNISTYADKKIGSVILGEKISEKDNLIQLDLLNYGSNARYGKDYYALIHLPEYNPGHSYSVSLDKIDASKKDTTKLEDIFSKKLDSSELYQNIRPKVTSNNGKPSLTLSSVAKGYAYALVKIPNSQFANAVYRLKVTSDSQDQPVAQSVIRSFWPEIPTSLLNLNTAIEMTKYIVSESKHKELRSGSTKEKEEKFREFWKSKDPTPNTEFNELMTEYYNRVDYAYEQFSSVNNLGFETDRGQIYIKYGEPENIERKFPSGEPAVEIWTYPSRRFVFRATTGFGDFKLVSN